MERDRLVTWDLGMDWEGLGCSHKTRIAFGDVFTSADVSAYSLLVCGVTSEDSLGVSERSWPSPSTN